MKIKISHDSFFNIDIADQKIIDIASTYIARNSGSIHSPIKLDALAQAELSGPANRKGLPHFSVNKPMSIKLEYGKEMESINFVYVEIKNVSSQKLMTLADWEMLFVKSASETFVTAPNGCLYVMPSENGCMIPQAIAPSDGSIILSYGILFSFMLPDGSGPYFGRIDPLAKITSQGGGE